MAIENITILINARNHQDYIVSCIDSALAVSDQIKLIIVNVNSSDETSNRILERISNLSEVIYIDLPSDHTQLEVFKHALNFVKTEFISIISGDDAYNLEFCNFLTQVDLDLKTVYCGCIVICDEFLNPIETKNSKWLNDSVSNRRKLLVRNPANSQGAVFPVSLLKDVLEKNSLPNIVIEDYWLWWHLLDNVDFVSVQAKFVNYRKHEKALTNMSFDKKYAYSLGYVTGLAYKNALGPFEKIISLILIPRWFRHIEIANLREYIDGYRCANNL